MKRLLGLLAALSILILIAQGAVACKDIIAIGDATAGDYNLLLKVRDPSRPGLQVLFMVNKSYGYDYHTPWTGRDIHFITQHKFIGVATKGDVPPDIIKAGMALSDAGIAYGDADVPSYWINPTRNAWDDFDWIRYACQSASSEKEARDLLIETVTMHAPGVAENLFVVGPEEAFVMEANAFNYAITEVHDIAAMSNYPKELWEKNFLKKAFIASSFDKTFEGNVRKGRSVHLGSLLGIKVVGVGEDSAVVRQVPFGERMEIKKGGGKVVGFFRVNVLDCSRKTAKLQVCYEYFTWENEMMDRIRSKYGSITPKDMMNWSRLHSDDMRGMCEGKEKAAAVFKIPYNRFDILSMGWFAPDQCSSIFIPVHISDTNIIRAYKNGEASDIALKLLSKFGHGNITGDCNRVEDVFITENDRVEELTRLIPEDAGKILTASDTGMQQQAILMQKIFLVANDNEGRLVTSAWNSSYRITLQNMRDIIKKIGNNDIKSEFASVALSIAERRAEMAKIAKNDNKAMKEYEKGSELITKGRYGEGLKYLVKSYDSADSALFGTNVAEITMEEKRNDYTAIAFGIIIAGVLLFFLIRKRL
ncbi:MAG: hypothetical protein U9O96_05505 [Candidatus Thermoplasmatota archaeon]|nr:hypothetical protein [Candidatus Thermoplasmatota archaeon]